MAPAVGNGRRGILCSLWLTILNQGLLSLRRKSAFQWVRQHHFLDCGDEETPAGGGHWVARHAQTRVEIWSEGDGDS